jgi:iron complex transport system permease protein
MSVPAPPRRAASTLALPIACAGLAVATVLSLAIGKYTVPVGDVVRTLLDPLTAAPADIPEAVGTVIWNIRLPRVLGGLLVGAALAAAGAAYQGMFRNPLVSPDILGVSAGAGFGALLGIYLGLPIATVQIAAFAGGLVAVGVAMSVAGRVRRHEPVLVLVLAGVAVGTLFAAASSLLKVLADPYAQLPTMTYWLMGSLSAMTRADLIAAAPAIAAGLVPLWLLRWRMNLLSLPDEEAAALGVSVPRVRAILIASATLVTAAAVSVSGTIGWVGLLVPHVARLVVGPDFRRLLPMAMVLGAAFLVATDTAARTVAPIEIPLGILTAIMGGPFFLWLLSRSRRIW